MVQQAAAHVSLRSQPLSRTCSEPRVSSHCYRLRLHLVRSSMHRSSSPTTTAGQLRRSVPSMRRWPVRTTMYVSILFSTLYKASNGSSLRRSSCPLQRWNSSARDHRRRHLNHSSSCASLIPAPLAPPRLGMTLIIVCFSLASIEFASEVYVCQLA